MKELRMHGRGGQGVVVGGEILSNAFLRDGKYLAVFPSFGVERRGTDISADGRLSDVPVREKSKSYEPDYIIIFDPSQITMPATYKGFRQGGIIVACGTDPEEILAMGVKPSRIVLVDGIRIAYELTGNNLTNMIMCGAFARATDIVSFESVLDSMREELPDNFVDSSVEGAMRGYSEAQVFDYDVAPVTEKRVPRWVDPPLSTKAPSPLQYEAPWGNFEDHYMVLPTGTWRSVRPVVNGEVCINCGICAAFCPLQCIEKRDGFHQANLDFCKGCGVCAHECPKKCIEMKLESDCK